MNSESIARAGFLRVGAYAAVSVAALLGASAAAAWRLLTRGPGRTYPPYRLETSSGWKKYHGNPVFGRDLEPCFDVCVLREGALLRMWFSWWSRGAIGLTESPDGTHWSAPILVLPPNSATGWEDRVNRTVVVRRPDGFHMWYTGQTSGSSGIGHAVSEDGRIWTRTTAHPVLKADHPWEKASVMSPHVLWDASSELFRMWYSAGDQDEPDATGYATSRDGLRWTKLVSNPTFVGSGGDSWDRDKVTGCQVIPYNRQYLMFYIGFYNTRSAEIGMARSPDGVSGWRRYAGNPVITPSRDSRAWDYDAVYKPFALPTGNGWMLWYNVRRGDLEQIGLAIHRGRDLGIQGCPIRSPAVRVAATSE
ncbi:MAG: hypothetical protein ACR2JC_07520 [Chloroflexota bacterium]